jgi:molecular chaperone GrpE
MERDQTFGPTHPTQPAAEEAAGGPREGEPTDGVHSAAETVPPVAPSEGDGASGPEARAAAAGVDQARADAAEPGEDAAAEEGAGPEKEPEPDYRDQYLRAMAELDNVRKRARRDVSQAEARGIAKLARELLPALDNFARALDAAESQPENRDHHLTDGIRLVQNELLSALARVGIEQDSPKGEPFDPHCHEAIAQQPVEGAASGTIVEVYSQGYRYRDDVLRPAKVVVAA